MSNPNSIMALSKKEKIILRILILLGLISIINFFYWFMNPELIDNHFLYWLLIGPLVFDSVRIIYIWYHYWDISVPVKPLPTKKLTADVFTTFFPGEPYEMIKETLLAIQKIEYPHTTYLCDEANDASLKEFCKQHGIVHVTRNNRIDAKAGNINNALKQAKGDICLILDPDHIPKSKFLDDVIPYFEDEKIGFARQCRLIITSKNQQLQRALRNKPFIFTDP
jgi:cellulose synthase (UDP-forming)